MHLFLKGLLYSKLSADNIYCVLPNWARASNQIVGQASARLLADLPVGVVMSTVNNDLNPNSPALFNDLIITMAYILDVQEDPCPYHAWRVGAVSAIMAEQLMPEHATDVFYAGLLHDIGAMGSFSHMMRFPTLNSQKAKPEVVAHPHRGSKIIGSITGMSLAAEFIADHHEWWNGCGYPLRKSEDMISLGAQIIRIADTADLGRKFHSESSPDQAVETARLLENIEISQDVADVFCKVVSREDFFGRLSDDSKLLELVREISTRMTPLRLPRNSDMLGSLLTVAAKMIDSKHCYSSGHSARVAGYAIDLGIALGLTHDEITKIRFAGLLHDAGKVAVRKSIIDKTGPLSPAEFLFVKNHPVLSMEILRDIARLPELAQIALHHHERWDGAGYPNGLKGDEIPLLSRVLAVADSMEAITAQRSYKPARTVREALEILRMASGTQLDPQIVEAAFSIWER